jgi:hypothetical protein
MVFILGGGNCNTRRRKKKKKKGCENLLMVGGA